jgi:hypothetical protein
MESRISMIILVQDKRKAPDGRGGGILSQVQTKNQASVIALGNETTKTGIAEKVAIAATN